MRPPSDASNFLSAEVTFKPPLVSTLVELLARLSSWVAVSTWESELMTCSAFSASPVSNASVDSRTACWTMPHTDARSTKTESSWSRKASRTRCKLRAPGKHPVTGRRHAVNAG